MSSSADWAALDRALDRALDLEGPEREAFLASLDGATREALAPLLRDALCENSFLDHPQAVLASLREDDGGQDEGRIAGGVRIGPYQVEALVGEGGMGRVFRAHRVDGAFDQTVAVKVVRTSLALAGSDVAARLRREREVLAALDHPGIARLLDGGETDDGVPYLVTEFVDGEAITTWADARALDVKGRVRLMGEVARAIDHAHRRFIVHRDLKPSNVLVTERDGAPRPVVLDFGIAKLLDDAERKGTHGFPLTRTGLCLLTPAYAAPELFEPEATVTTAADVFGLGALLYELLTDRRPREVTATSGPPTTEVTRPSKAVTQPLPKTATKATFDPAQRARALRGDLDTICLKALHPDPARRYASAADLADDLARHLDGRPVEARPDSLAYVAGRFARRHRVALAAAVVALVALVGGLGVALVALGNERAAHAEAEAAAARAGEAADLLAGLFAQADPAVVGDRALTARELLDHGFARVAEVESDLLRGHLLGVLAMPYLHNGQLALADSLYTEALALLSRAEDAPVAMVTQARIQLADSRVRLGEYEAAAALFRQAHEDLREAPTLDREAEVRALAGLAFAQRELGQHEEAYRNAVHAVALVRKEGRDEEVLARALYEFGHTLQVVGRPDEALRAFEEALALFERLYGPESSRAIFAVSAVGAALIDLGRLDEAESLLWRSTAYYARVFGQDHHYLAEDLALMGDLYQQRGEDKQAVALMDSALVIYRPRLPGHPLLATLAHKMAVLHNRLGNHEEAVSLAQEALTIAEEQTPKPDALLARTYAQLGLALSVLGRDAEARPILQRALRAFEAPEVQAALEGGEAEAMRAALAALPEK